MKNYYFYYIIPLCIIILFFACSGKQADGPDIEFETELYNFGEVNEGEKVTYTFIFKNTGKENIIITNVRPTCGCTVAGKYDTDVKPGESGKIPIKLHTDGYQGEISKIIRVTTNVPQKEELVLTLRGTVFTPIIITPKHLWLGQIHKTESSLSGVYTIKNNSETPLKILEIIPPHKNITVQSITVKPDQEYQINITVNPPFKEERVSEIIQIKTNNPDSKTLTLRYSYQVQVDIYVYPQNIYIEPGIMNKKSERIVKVESYFTESVSLINPQVIGGTLDFMIEELTPGKTYQIKLLFPAGFKLEEKDILVFSFQIKRGENINIYNIPIQLRKTN